MRNLSAQGRVAFLGTALLAFSLLGSSIVAYGLPVEFLAAFVTLLVVSVIADLHPIHTPSGDGYHTIADLFCYAGLFLLPLSWALLLYLARLMGQAYTLIKRLGSEDPESWQIPLLNQSTVIVANCALLWALGYLGARSPRSPYVWLIFTLVVAACQATQALLLQVVYGLMKRTRWNDLGIKITPEAFVIDTLQAVLGVLLAGWWYAARIALPAAILASVGFYRVIQLSQDAEEFHTDPKTGLYNARYLERQLARAIDRSSKKEVLVSLIFADVDNLRDINNTHGHLLGDAALTTVAAVLRDDATGAGFVASRFGGEEFVVMLPGVAKSDAALLAERLRASLEARTCALPSGDSLRVTMSLGVATCPEDGQTNYDLIRAADHAMYHAKAAGRNRVCWAGQEQPVSGEVAASQDSVTPV